MESNAKSLQEAIELLIRQYEETRFGSRFGNSVLFSPEGTETCGAVTIHCSDDGGGDSSIGSFGFSIELEGNLICRGIIRYKKCLYIKQMQEFRESVLSAEYVKGIITIEKPKSSYSSIALILFDREDPITWFASCGGVDEAASLLLGEPLGTIQVHYAERVDSTNLLPDYYDEKHRIISSALESIQTKSLEELAEIIPGKSARAEDYREEGIDYIRARDIHDGSIFYFPKSLFPEAKHPVRLDYETALSFSRCFLQEGDILLTKHFGQRKLALVTNGDLPAIASSAIYIIRPFSVSEKYLYRYLTSVTGNAVFNSQLKRIEKGATVSSINLSDLKKIQVPLYDEEMMQTIEQMDDLTEEEGIEAALKIIYGVRDILGSSEQDISDRVYDELISAGWVEERFKRQDPIVLENGKKWYSDYSYSLPDDVKAYFEIKPSISGNTPEWQSAIERILTGSTKCIYILTTGHYYEVHITGHGESLKVFHAPTIDEIANWERGLN